MLDIEELADAERRFDEQEHRDLAAGLACLADTAAVADSLSDAGLADALRGVVGWLEGSLEPHAAWEDAVLYPEIDRLAGTPWATRLMRFEHVQIRRGVERVGRLRQALATAAGRGQVDELRAALWSLHALVKAHIEREERFLVPVLSGRVRPAGTDRP